jgi:hypothetical protein
MSPAVRSPALCSLDNSVQPMDRLDHLGDTRARGGVTDVHLGDAKARVAVTEVHHDDAKARVAVTAGLAS